MPNKTFIVIISIFFSITLFAQTKCIGTVKNINEEYISNVSVICKDKEGHIVSFSFTDDEGKFSINTENEGSFMIEVNKSGFTKQQKELFIEKKNQTYKLDFVLEEHSDVLEDLIIEIDAPIQQRGDTLSYDAKAFSTGREQVVEDLLKNIPGITVDKQGQIRYHNTLIEKVMVDGDDLFNRGYSILTKNMPNKPLDKVQVLRNYSNNKLLKGVEESDAVALNLTIDESYKDLWFGDITTGYGLVTENRYDVTGNLMNFSKKYKNFINFGLNNIGIDRVGLIDEMFYNNNEIQSVGKSNVLYHLMSLNGVRAGQLKDHRTRINNAENVALSSIIPVTEKLKIKIAGFLGFDENYAFNNQFSITSVGDTYFENSESNQFKSHLRKFYINLFATYDISKTQMLQVSSAWNQGSANNYNDLTFNGTSTKEQLESKNTFIDQKITYSHKWKDKNVVLLKTRYFSNKIPQFYNIDDYLMGNLFSFDADAINNDIKNEKTFAGIEADFKLKQKNNDLIEFQFGYQHNEQTMNTVFKLFDGNTTIQPEGFQTDSSFTLGDLYVRSGYTWKWTNFKISGFAEAHQLFNKFTSLDSSRSQNLLYVNPSANFTWELSPTEKIFGSYMINFNNIPTVTVNDTYLLSSSRSFSKGLGSFALLDTQISSLGYTISHSLSRYNISFSLNYRKQSKSVSSRITLEQNSSLSESILIKGGETFSFNMNSNFFLRSFMRSSFKVAGQYSTSTYYNEINNSGLRKNKNYSQNYNLEWATGYKEGFNFLLGTEWYFNKIKSPDFSNNFNNTFSYLELYYTRGKLDLKTVTEHYHFGNLDKNNKDHFFVDFESSYTMKDKYTIGLRANNILNKKKFTTYRISDIGYSTMSYSLLSRYILLSLKIRF